MSVTVQSNPSALVESIARRLPPGAAEDFRNLMNQVILANLTSLSPGGNLIAPGGTQAGASAPPSGVLFSVVGKSGVWTVKIVNPSTAKPGTIFHEVSYSEVISFTKNVTTLPVTTSQSITVPGSGLARFFRIRSSYDQKTWSNYKLASTSAVDARLIEAAAMSAGAAFNQTNYGEVNSQASGASAIVTISGTGGPLTSYPAVRGASEAIRPSATIVGVTPESEQFVGYDGTTFHLKPTLAAVLADNLEPVGKVSVVSTTPPTLPTIVPVIVGGAIVGYNVTAGGAGASQPYTLTIFDSGGGVGATAGAQTIVAGVLISVAPGNPGSGYTGATTVTPSGGSGGGQSGGGTTTGGNGGRMTAV